MIREAAIATTRRLPLGFIVYSYVPTRLFGMRKNAMPYVDAAGVKLCCEETGQDCPIIFVHEFGSDLHAWEDQVRCSFRAYRRIKWNARSYPFGDVPEDAALCPNAEFTAGPKRATAEPLRMGGIQQ
jgi:pimeloyl-ACP methyl ester carboxylesterase